MCAHPSAPPPACRSLVLSAPAVDPSTLAPKGTILAAEKAQDSRATVRVPFTQVIPTLLKVRRPAERCVR